MHVGLRQPCLCWTSHLATPNNKYKLLGITGFSIINYIFLSMLENQQSSVDAPTLEVFEAR